MIQKGTVVVFTYGEYSDFGYSHLGVVMKEFDMELQRDIWLEDNPPYCRKYHGRWLYYDSSKFALSLVNDGFITLLSEDKVIDFWQGEQYLGRKGTVK